MYSSISSSWTRWKFAGCSSTRRINSRLGRSRSELWPGNVFRGLETVDHLTTDHLTTT